MSEHANKREKRLAMLVVAAVVLFTVLLIVETFRLLLPGLWSAFSAGDEQALSEYLASQGRLRSFLTLWFLAVVQVLSLVIPAMPVQLAAGLAYGPWMGFLTSFSASAVANMSVYLIARRLVPVIRRLVGLLLLRGRRGGFVRLGLFNVPLDGNGIDRRQLEALHDAVNLGRILGTHHNFYHTVSCQDLVIYGHKIRGSQTALCMAVFWPWIGEVKVDLVYFSWCKVVCHIFGINAHEIDIV